MMNFPNKNATDHHLMILNGTGQVTAIPDIAVIRLGVQTNGEDLAAVQQENARLSQAVLGAIEGMGITDIKTYEYTINKNYEYQDGKQIDKGFTVRNIFEIRTSNLDQVGELIDVSVDAGANVVDLIDFEVSDINAYYNEALNNALDNAFEKARSITANIGVLLNPIPACYAYRAWNKAN
ncbi:MAG: hypothetical protein K0S04_2184 [Herbinix sp.]|nr:hypothetical protein [Herbinix sp.]